MKTYKVYIESKWYDVDILDSNQDFVNVSVEGTLFKVLFATNKKNNFNLGF